MRIVPIMTAILVAFVLYMVILQRDTLRTFANGGGLDRAIAVARGEAEPLLRGSGDAGADAEKVGDTPRTSADADPATTSDDTANTPPLTGAEIDAALDAAEASDSASDQPARKPVGVVAVHSTARQIDSAVILRGQTDAARLVELRAETTSRVASPPLPKGTMVEAGDLLCELDPGTRATALAEAEGRLAEAEAAVPTTRARVAEAKARLNEAEINFNAATKLSADGFASSTRVASSEAAVRAAEATIAQAEAGLTSSRAAIQSAEAAVAAARKEIERLEIHAPFAGLLESDTAELGSLLQAGGLCATVIGLDPIKLVGFLPEAQVERVKVGARAGARLAASGREVVGKVTFLSRSADATTRTFRVEIDVPNPDLAIRDGQTAEIGIEADGVLAHLLPQSALTLNDDGDLGVRIVTAQDTADFVPVTLLRDTADGIWLTGLPDQADVIIIGQEYVIAGVPVAPSYQEPSQ
ncbi:efflux RND transporter periplasmic adaptor subunit [Pseudooceanicola aestuarii]|uniref:efflux RND transporter periplasmic adaptor subunit n=1 Tax=Pseudooceanicola aestuarii TaxID=2697319 RepID=UPI0013D279FC|nr:efflux RND transporter periplasmic adaptor subunit [Pseudooceanicola aestuarii]